MTVEALTMSAQAAKATEGPCRERHVLSVVMENKPLTCNLSHKMSRRCARYLAWFHVDDGIYSEDAPALEVALHRRFVQNLANKVNRRKEFFRLRLQEIRSVFEEMKYEVRWMLTIPRSPRLRCDGPRR
jgi:hypothetical protein